MRRLGNIKAFHNISTNYSKISIDGVTVNDLLSMIRTMMDKHGIEKWKLLIDDLYKHIVDLKNPHRFTIEQLDVAIIDVIYKQWIDEGYTGSKQEFIDIFFTYVKLADLEDMDIVIEGISEEYVPVVAVLAEYVRLHDINLQAHEEQFLAMFGSKEDFPNTRFVPAFAVTRMCNIGLKNFYDYETNINDLRHYPLKGMESVEGLYIFQVQLNESIDTIATGLDECHFHMRPNVDVVNTDKLATRHITLRANKKYISYVYSTPETANYTKVLSVKHDYTGDILNIAIKLNKDNTSTLYYEDKKHVLGIPDNRVQQLDSLIKVPKLLSFPERVEDKDYLTLGVAYFVGKYNDAQIKYLLTSYWPNPKE